MQLFPLTPSLATISIPYNWLKGLEFKKGVCVWPFMPGVSCPGAPLVWWPFFGAIPFLWFTGEAALDPATSVQSQMKFSGLPQ